MSTSLVTFHNNILKSWKILFGINGKHDRHNKILKKFLDVFNFQFIGILSIMMQLLTKSHVKS